MSTGITSGNDFIGLTLSVLLAVACGATKNENDTPRERELGAGGVGHDGVVPGSRAGAGGGSQGAGRISSELAGAGGAAPAASVNAGATPTGSAGAPGDGDDIPKELVGNAVFSEDEVLSYYLTLSDEEYAKLTDLSTLLNNPWEVNEDRYVRASLRVGDTELPSVAVRFKGNYSIWGCVDFATGERVVRVEPFFGNIDVCQRFSLKLDFDRYDDNSRLDGLKKLNLHAMAADPSKMRERLAYSLFREMEVVAPRAVHARVFINEEYQGLFAAVEVVDGRFTANRFPASGDGNLYRDLWPATDLTPAAAEEALRTNDDPGQADVANFMTFASAVAAANEADFASQMAPYLDFDYLARYFVVDRGINNYDGPLAFYFGPGWGPYNANYYWYEGGEGRFTLVPWDFDKAFWYPEPNFWSDNAPNGGNIVPNWNVITSDCEGYVVAFDAKRTLAGVMTPEEYSVREIDCDPFLRLLRGQIYDRQKAIAEAFIAGPFSEESVAGKLEAWGAQIRGSIAEDPGVDSAQWESSVDALLADLPNLHGNLNLMMSGLIAE